MAIQSDEVSALRPRWVVFDIGGVLFDANKAFTKIAEQLGVSTDILINYVNPHLGKGELGGMTFEDLWENILKTLGQQSQIEQVLSTWWDRSNWANDTLLLIEQLTRQGYSIALFTNNWSGMGARIIKEVPELSVIKHIFESSVHGMRKPDIKFYKLVEKEINAHASQIYFVDDYPENITAAKKLGWQTFLYALGNDFGASSNERIRHELL